MKYLLNLGMAEPLTLKMGHPLQTRIARLQNVDKRHRILPAAIGIAVLSASALSPVSAKTVEAAEGVTVPLVSASTNLADVNSPDTQRDDAALYILKMAEVAPVATPAMTNQAPSGLAPMRLRMSPEFTDEQLAESERLRAKAVGGEAGGKTALNHHYSKISFYNRYEVNIFNDGSAYMDISKGNGGWPGEPKSNTDWERRPLSADMKRGLQAVLERCANSNSPVYFPATTVEGDADIGRGLYHVECTPGTEAVRAATSKLDLADAYLASDDLPLERRQNNMDWKTYFALMEDYVAQDIDHSILKDREACVRITNRILADYAVNDKVQKSMLNRQAKCSEANYNWVRKRMKIAEVR